MPHPSHQLSVVGSTAAGRTLPLRGMLTMNETAGSVVQVATCLTLPPEERYKKLFIFIGDRIGLIVGGLLGSRLGPIGFKVGKTLGSLLGAFLVKLLYACCSRPAPKQVQELPAAPVVIEC